MSGASSWNRDAQTAHRLRKCFPLPQRYEKTFQGEKGFAPACRGFPLNQRLCVEDGGRLSVFLLRGQLGTRRSNDGRCNKTFVLFLAPGLGTALCDFAPTSFLFITRDEFHKDHCNFNGRKSHHCEFFPQCGKGISQYVVITIGLYEIRFRRRTLTPSRLFF